MLYPQYFMEELRARVPVSEVIGRRVGLRRHGREFQGLCPFHKEKTPSFTVNDEKGFYHCFGCGAHGDAIGFIKEYEGISYKEAIERLAGEAGLTLPQPTAEQEVRDRQRRSLHDVTEIACRWFETQLALAGGHAARHYLAERGLSEETIGRFRIGYAPDDREALKRALVAEGFDERQLIDAGLLIQVDGKTPYSRFRGRIMFPIRDHQSRVVAFGGRIMPGSSQTGAPKYLNSPEGELFHKGHMLYNLDRARRPAQENKALYLCEGYMDVIALAQGGIHHAVAPLGTAVTAEQLQLCWRCADEPTVCLDGDAAGQRATARLCELALPMLTPGKSLKFIRLPEGEDPDSLVRTRGVTALEELARQAPGLADILWKQVTAEAAQSPEMRAGQESRLMQLAESIKDPMVKAHYRAHFKQRFWSQPRDVMRRVTSTQIPRQQAVQVPHLLDAQDLRGQVERTASQCLALALLYPALLATGENEELIATIPLHHPDLARLRTVLIDLLAERDDWTRKTLRAALESCGHDGAMHALLQAVQAIAPPILLADQEESCQPLAARLWHQTVNQYQLIELQKEYKQAEAELSAEINQERMDRLMALKTQLDAVEKERDRLYRQTLLEEDAV